MRRFTGNLKVVRYFVNFAKPAFVVPKFVCIVIFSYLSGSLCTCLEILFVSGPLDHNHGLCHVASNADRVGATIKPL